MSIKKNEYTRNIVDYAFHGIDETVPADATAVVELRDLLKVHATLSEFVRFFHQPLHMQTLDDVKEYLGTADTNGAYKLLKIARYEIMNRMLPPEAEAYFDEGCFDSPAKPYYFEAKSDEP